jgi:bacterial/archaeal transporter family protein
MLETPGHTMQAFSALKARWFGYSLICVLCWGAWALLQKMGSVEIPAKTVQFLFAFGAMPVAVALLAARRFQLEKSAKGIFYGLMIGILAGIGNAGLAAAYRTGGNTSVVTAATAMYPVLSVVLAVLVLRERLTRLHILGLCFAAAAFILFSV